MNKTEILNSYIDQLITNLNNTNISYFKNLYCKDDYYREILKSVVSIMNIYPYSSIEEYRNLLFIKSGISNDIKDLIIRKKIAPGIVINFGTKYNREIIISGHNQEVLQDQNKIVTPNPKSMTYDTIFDLASTSKLLTTISILKLCECGYLNLEDEVIMYAPQFTNLKGISIMDLITFGVPIKTDGRVDTQSNISDAQKTLFSLHKNEYPSFQDIYYPYTDMGAMTLKFIIENVTHMSLKEFIEEEIFAKANMKSSFLNVPEDLKNKVANENYSTIVKADGSFSTKYETYPGITYDGKSIAMGHNLGNAPGHAGFFSTTADMINLAQALIDKKILSENSLLSIGNTYTGKQMEDTNGNIVLSSHHGMLCFTKQLNKDFPYAVQPFLSGKAFLQPGYAGTSLCIDPLNEVYSFIAANRLHNRIHAVNENQIKNIAITQDGERYMISDTGERKTLSTSYKSEIYNLTKKIMILTLQYQLLEKIFASKQHLTLKRTI